MRTLLLLLALSAAAHAQTPLPFALADAAGDTLVQVNADGTLQTSAAEAASDVWRLGGNAGTAPGTHFLGTSGEMPFEIRVDGRHEVRWEAASVSSGVYVVRFRASGPAGEAQETRRVLIAR